MAMSNLDTQDSQLFCELPNLNISPEAEGRRLKLDGSLADAYIEKLRELRPETIEYNYSRDPFKDNSVNSGRYALALESNDCFCNLEEFLISYLKEKKPVRRFPGTKQLFWNNDKLGEMDLDYIQEMDGGPNALWWYDSVNHCVLNSYRTELERINEGVKHLRPYFKRRRTVMRAPAQVLLGAAALAASVGILRNFVFGLFPALSCPLLFLVGLFLLTRGTTALSFKTDLRKYYERLNEGGRLMDIYRYARFCQLWCQAAGREMPETLKHGLPELQKTIDRCRRIARFYPELVRQ